ncbi:MAG: Wzz/FepE/Etk N-terminal domain-containing protein [candidate division KSB1 bacterium]|nr:Wzz/FepE/Etk N-terminal domain-containing protein [candidate division KSB1 bacterium]MDZ7357785.1 Wzz/FepE/Etk N-terminal domain-containing protein [candidate division KSB1 bacterium]
MSAIENQQFDFSKYLQIIVQRKWVVVGCLMIVVIPVMILNQVLAPIYRADTKIIFEEHRSVADPSDPYRLLSNKSFIKNQIEEIKSRSVAEAVVQNLPVEVINSFPIPKNPGPNFSKEQYIAERIQKSIEAKAVPYSEVIEIHVEAYTPEAVALIANKLVEVLQERNLGAKIKETGNVRSIIEAQLETFKKQLDEAELALKTFREQNEVTSIDKEAEEIYRRITEAENIYNKTTANLDAARKRLAFIKEKLDKEREALGPALTETSSPWAQKLKQQLVDLEVQYTTLKLQDYAEDHPKLAKLREQIAEVKKNLKEESTKIATGESVVDPISQIQKFMSESIDIEIEIQTYQAQQMALKRVIDSYQQRLQQLPHKELRLAQLMRDKEVNEKIYKMLLEKKEETKITEAERVGNIRVIDPAKVPDRPSRPHKLLNLVLSIVFGLMLGCGLALSLEYLDRRVKAVEDIERITELNLLATIPVISFDRGWLTRKILRSINGKASSHYDKQLVAASRSSSPEAEAFRTLRTRLLNASATSPKTVLITSPNPNEGKSLITANLGIVISQLGMKTLLIEADLRKPMLHLLFQKRRKPGLIDCLNALMKIPSVSKTAIVDEKTDLNSEGDWEERVSVFKNRIIATKFPNLDLLTSGSPTSNPSELLASPVMSMALEVLKKQYDIILIDTPPINAVSDAGVLKEFIDASVLVVRAGFDSEKEIRRAKELLQREQGEILGLVVNFATRWEKYYRYDYYYYDDHKKRKRRLQFN